MSVDHGGAAVQGSWGWHGRRFAFQHVSIRLAKKIRKVQDQAQFMTDFFGNLHRLR
jgi:hypothetical protein